MCTGNEQVCACTSVCLCLGVMKKSRVYIILCSHICALPLIPEGLFGVFCAGFGRGRWVLGVLHSDVISPDNGLVKAGILQAPSLFDCVGQLWRNGHYLPVSGSIKKHLPPPTPPCPSYPCVRVPTGGGTWAGHTLVWRK